jgi:hypothetical protein
MLCLEQPTENAPVFTAETIANIELEERGYRGERDYFPEHTEFCRDLRAQAAASGAGYPSNMECQAAYGRAQRETDETNEWAERDRLERAAEIANEAAAYTSGISTHVAFDKLHSFVANLEQKSRRTFHVAELTADLHLAAFHALHSDLTAWAFYQLWASGAAADIAPHILARSVLWYRIRSLVGNEIIRRGLLNGYFKKSHKRKKR